jgi:hypothetical protein
MGIEEMLKHIGCSHNETTESDENGDAICLKCGSVIQIRFNMERFKAAIKKLYEQ